MSTINYSHLRPLAVFAAVVESGSFAAAARRLGSSRSRVSEQVAQLEAVLDVRLLQRSTRQLSLTTEGQQIYSQACVLPSILESVEALVSSPEPQGRVSLTINHDIAHKHLLPHLQTFSRRFPGIQLELVLDDTTLDLIHERIDLGIRVGIPSDDSLVARVLHEECFKIYASTEYVEQYGKPETTKDLARHHWIVISQLGRSGLQVFRQRGKMLEVQPKSYTLCNSPLLMQQLVIGGHGIGACFESTVKEELDQGRLVQLMPTIASEPQVMYLVYPSRRQVPPRTRALIDFLLGVGLFDT
ncbi:MAG: LysR family transcriptional regulator [Granulosicoccaceae bacterium]